ncbi:MAG: DUF6765 family protein [Deltaproteobacteria bacterium]
MEIDFHHAVTYVLARLAGFNAGEAEIIAYSAQYVDDAIYDNTVLFNNGAIYKPVCSAHKALDYRNFNKLANHLVWVPFHFLPGNCFKKEDECKEDFYLKIICRPNSYIADDMIRECIRRHKEPNALYRLGITMHVYADTWAHQGFSGIQHFSNRVQFLDDETSRKLGNKVAKYFSGIFDNELSKFLDDVMPIGHGAVLSYPDKPYLKWKYKDYSGKLIERDNPAIFLDAAKNMFVAMQRFRAGNSREEGMELSKEVSNLLLKQFNEINDVDSRVRHKRWMKILAQGALGFSPVNLSYSCDGPGSWEYKAFSGKKNTVGIKYEYNEIFENSNWKSFHDALAEHHYFLLHVLFPKYKLCIA